MKQTAKFGSLRQCWICGGEEFVRIHKARFDFALYRQQDAELADYTGQNVWLNRCRRCTFAQPEQLPTLANFFDRMYDQRWSSEWIEAEFHAPNKDSIFHSVLQQLDRLVPYSERRLLDVGAHTGRFLTLARQRDWQAEGVELNPRTANFAARKTGLPVHQVNAHQLVADGRQYEAITLTDVLEHIPDPVKSLRIVHQLLAPDGWVGVKVPNGRNQLFKEQLRERLKRGYRATVADNLVHVNHFSPQSLRLALQTAGFSKIRIWLGAPELVTEPTNDGKRNWLINTFRRAVFYLAQTMPGGIHTPLALNLQAYAQKSSG